MNQDVVLFIVIMLLPGMVYFAWQFGTHNPNNSLKKQIGLEAIKTQFSNWYVSRDWECVDVDENYPGFMGLPCRVIFLYSNGETIRLSWSSKDINKGNKGIKLRPSTNEEISGGCWVSATDRFIKPDII